MARSSWACAAGCFASHQRGPRPRNTPLTSCGTRAVRDAIVILASQAQSSGGRVDSLGPAHRSERSLDVLNNGESSPVAVHGNGQLRGSTESGIGFQSFFWAAHVEAVDRFQQVSALQPEGA